MSDKTYLFTETPAEIGEVRIEWRTGDRPQDPLDFWIVPASLVEDAKRRVSEGLFDAI